MTHSPLPVLRPGTSLKPAWSGDNFPSMSFLITEQRVAGDTGALSDMAPAPRKSCTPVIQPRAT